MIRADQSHCRGDLRSHARIGPRRRQCEHASGGASIHREPPVRVVREVAREAARGAKRLQQLSFIIRGAIGLSGGIAHLNQIACAIYRERSSLSVRADDGVRLSRRVSDDLSAVAGPIGNADKPSGSVIRKAPNLRIGQAIAGFEVPPRGVERVEFRSIVGCQQDAIDGKARDRGSDLDHFANVEPPDVEASFRAAREFAVDIEAACIGGRPEESVSEQPVVRNEYAELVEVPVEVTRDGADDSVGSD